MTVARLLCLPLLALCLALGSCRSENDREAGRAATAGAEPTAAAAAAGTDTAYVAQVDAWHARRLASLTRPDGWLSLVALLPLPESGEASLGSAPEADVRLPEPAPARVGRLTVTDGRVTFTAAEGVDVRIAGEQDETGGAPPATAPLRDRELATDAGGQPTVLATGSLRFYPIERDGRLYLRVKDTESELRRDFPGIERFPVDERWRVTARLAGAAGDTVVEVPDVLGGVSREASPGVLEFELAGHPCRLRPMGGPGEPLFIVFADSTSGLTTYGGGRFLSAEPPAADGTVVLDFNRATNPPCAFTPFATCPMPPAGNTLPVAVTAGEKAYGEPGAAHGAPQP